MEELETMSLDEKILEQVKSEVNFGLSYVQTKRQTWRDRLALYVSQNKAKDKISINTIYASTQLHIAVNYSDELVALWEGRWIGDEEYADNINKLCEFDKEVMWWDVMYYQLLWDTYAFGFSPIEKFGYNKKKQVGEFRVKDPMSAIPDPLSDHLNPFRFYYFEEILAKNEISKEFGFRDVDFDFNTGLTDEQDNTRTMRNTYAGLDTQEDTTPNGFISCYNWYTLIDDEWHQVSVDTQFSKVLRANKIEILDGDEEAKCPLAVSWYSPQRGNPFGVAWWDLIEDKQRAESTLANLRLIDAKFATFGQTNIYDSRIITDKATLITPSIETKWIGADWSKWAISSAVYPLPRQNITQDSWNVSQELKAEIQKDTGMDNRTMWAEGNSNITLGESQQIQANANIRFALSMNVMLWGIKDFFLLWYRCYKEYFEETEKKTIRVTNWFGNSYLTFRKWDFIAGFDPDVKVVSKRTAESLRANEKLSFQAKLPLLLQDPTIPEVSKKIAMRKALRLDWFKPDEILTMIPPTYEELDAKKKIEYINAEMEEWYEVDNMDVDHMTYIIMFAKAVDNKYKEEAIRRRKEAYIIQKSTKPIEQQGWLAWIANASSAQLTSASIQQNKQPLSLSNQ